MKVKAEYLGGNKILASNDDNQVILMGWGDDSKIGLRPMEGVLACLAGCSMVDIVEMIKKMRRAISEFKVEVSGERVEEYPRVFHTVKIKYTIASGDLKQEELERAVKLSMEKYCSVAAMLRRGGVNIEYEYRVIRP